MAIAIFALFSIPAIAQDPLSPPSEVSVPPVQEMLSGAPWFDADQGEIKSVPVRTQSDDSINRGSRWLPKPKKVKAAPASSAATPAAAPGAGAGTGWFTVGNAWAWVLVALIIAGLVALILFALSKTEFEMGSANANASKTGKHTPDEQMLRRIEELPAELRRTDVNPRSEAERLMNAGQFDQAIILLFGHQLLLLDGHGLLRLSRGKTNGKYVRETRMANADCGNWLRQTATAFERSFFGNHSLTSAEFRQLWQQNQMMETAVSRTKEAA
ncbi:DUF4129 domain-containing protein [Stieleria varia]|nr:DUF4129 domain-containing protein [Stieleria varia]